jgi:uncharacterized protein (DUF1499 family)
MARHSSSGGSVRNAIGMLAAMALVAGPLVAYLRLVPALLGFLLFALGGIVALLVTLASLVQAARGRGFGRGAVVATIAAAVFVGAAVAGGGGPRINDFTTDTADPPRFVALAEVGPNPDRDLTYPPAFAAVQASCCADLAPARLDTAPATAFARAQRAAAAMPRWEVVAADAGDGRIEAIATTRLFGFKDDVVIRVRPGPDGGSIVDVRSKSRDGQGDVGANAARIRAYLDALQKTAS